MYFSKLKAPALQRVTVSTFLGCDGRDRAADGSFVRMENLCSDGYPAMKVRPRRGTVGTLSAPHGLTAREALVWVDGHTLYVGGKATGLVLADSDKQFAAMGAYLLIFPDKKWINLRDLTQFGAMENSVTTDETVRLSLCRADGSGYGQYLAAQLPPEEPEEGDLWLDLSGSEPVLRQYGSEVWTEVADTCVKLLCSGIGVGFSAGDGVEISGCQEERLNGTAVLRLVSDEAVVIGGILAGDTQQTEPVTIRRAVPEMDFVVECGNRLWGCKYGVVDGQAVNEIYASKLGDFRNWNCYQGLSTDSYAAARGSDGPFTAAASYLGSALFFKERCIERVYVSAAGAHQIVTLECPGAAPGSHKSVCSVDGTLYYQGTGGVYAFDGGLPAVVSQTLGSLPLQAATAGALEGKYYLSAADGYGQHHLLVYDSRRGLWHREDGLQVLDFACWGGELYALATDGALLALRCRDGVAENTVTWLAETGDLGLDTAEHKYPMRLSLRLALEEGGSVTAALSGDQGETWEAQGTLTGQGLASAVTLHLRPRRSAHVRLRLTGSGACTLYSVSAVYEKGSDET